MYRYVEFENISFRDVQTSSSIGNKWMQILHFLRVRVARKSFFPPLRVLRDVLKHRHTVCKNITCITFCTIILYKISFLTTFLPTLWIIFIIMCANITRIFFVRIYIVRKICFLQLFLFVFSNILKHRYTVCEYYTPYIFRIFIL